MSREADTFFFQAEDGIRDGHVTGVQTCALPIFLRPAKRPVLRQKFDVGDAARVLFDIELVFLRSEERRVGKSVDLGGWRIVKRKGVKSTPIMRPRCLPRERVVGR